MYGYTESINKQDKSVRLVIVPTWVTLTLKERNLPVSSLLDDSVRSSIFSNSELVTLQVANTPIAAGSVLGDVCFTKSYKCGLYRFPEVKDLQSSVDAIVNRLSSSKPQEGFNKTTLPTDLCDILFGADIPHGHVLDATCVVVDHDDHVDVLIVLLAKDVNEIKLAPGVKDPGCCNNMAKVSDALYVRNFPLKDLISMGLFKV